jgi:UDP-N-acetylmuramate: L-alanyl-gamma-D-glutamyl-meso-diaminopimelate ligase
MPHRIPDPDSIETIHLMAICGTAMGAYAGLLQEAGFTVTGSDAGVYPPMSTQLLKAGIALMEGFKAENLDHDPDLVIVGNAISSPNPEAVAMRERDLDYASFPETLGALFLDQRHPVVVAGTHGKTTTSSVLAHCLHHLGDDPGFLVGGVLENFGCNYRVGRPGAHFVVEGDEYDTAYFDKVPKFIHYRPRTAVLTSVEFDHADIYRDLEHVREAFRSFVTLIPEDGLLLACADGEHVAPIADLGACCVEYYSTRGAARAQWRGEIVSADPQGMTFRVSLEGEDIGTFRCMLVGEHNLANLTAVVGVLIRRGFAGPDIGRALEAYRGVKRRQTVFGEVRGVTLIDDFAHHPTAVKATIEATRLRFGADRRLWTIFEPRTNTTRRNIFQDLYGRAFDGTDLLLVAPVDRPEKVKDPAQRFSVPSLVSSAREGGVDARLTTGVDDIIEILAAHAQPGDVVLILSNGGFGGIYERLPEALGRA